MTIGTLGKDMLSQFNINKKDTLTKIFTSPQIADAPFSLGELTLNKFSGIKAWADEARYDLFNNRKDYGIYSLFFDRATKLFTEGGECLAQEISLDRRKILKLIFPYLCFLVYADNVDMIFNANFQQLFDDEHPIDRAYKGMSLIYLATVFQSKKIIQRGFDADLFKLHDMTLAICIAIMCRDKEMFNLLVSIVKSKNFDLSTINDNYDFIDDPLFHAVKTAQSDMLEILLGLNIKLGSFANFLSSYLHSAVQVKSLECVKLLIAAGDDIHHKVLDKTPLDRARSQGTWDIASLLSQADKNGTADTAKKDCVAHQGQILNVSKLDKIDVAVGLYSNLTYPEPVYGAEVQQLKAELLKNNFKLLTFNSFFLGINLSGDVLDPTDYDDRNETYYNKKLCTAYQCIEALKEKMGLINTDKNEATLTIQKLLNTKGCQFNSSGWLYFYPQISFEHLVEIGNLFQQMNLSASVHPESNDRFPSNPPHIAFMDDYKKIIQHINTYQATRENRIAHNI